MTLSISANITIIMFAAPMQTMQTMQRSRQFKTLLINLIPPYFESYPPLKKSHLWNKTFRFKVMYKHYRTVKMK